VPEPDLTPEAIVARARALIPAIRAQQDEAEKIGHHTRELDEKFTSAGFYRVLQPRRFGGYAFGMDTFWKVILAVAEGDPGTAWGLCLGTHHAQGLGAWFPEEGQRELFGRGGEFKCPHRAAPMGTATPVAGGYRVSGQWDYCSGVAHATHFMANTLIPGREEEGVLTICTPIGNVTVVQDWGDGAILGMNSSGSNSVRAEDVFVPGYCTCSGDWTHNTTEPAPGMALHGPLFCGRIYAMYHAGLVIPVIGAARASLNEYEHIITTKNTYFPPQVPRYTVEEYQRHFGQAQALTDCAEAIIIRAGERYMELARRWHETGEPFSREDDARLYAMIQQAAQLAIRATTELFGAASSSAAKRGTRMQRYYRDMSVYLGHISARHDVVAADVARLHFGLPDNLFLARTTVVTHSRPTRRLRQAPRAPRVCRHLCNCRHLLVEVMRSCP
jgi:3-hydroxy-9,10-secoandrosta-1,3,5(10)-triene-9,17-dione monooxygenase